MYEDDKVVEKYQKSMQNSWVWKDMYATRNIKNAFRRGTVAGFAY